MRIDISDITKIDGASLDIVFEGQIEGLEEVVDDAIIDKQVAFDGKMTNLGGTLKLEGNLNARYSSKCYRCLKDLDKNLNIRIKEDFIGTGNKQNDEEAYTYEGNYIIIDKTLKDNIILNLPMKQLCTEKCKGLCSRCGMDLNEQMCKCRDEEMNPKMEVLKDFFKND